MPTYRDEAVVLRTQKLGEADRIVTLLTRRHGRVRAVAKGVRRTKSRFGCRLEPFMQADLQLYEGRNLDTVTQAETIEPFGDRVVGDYSRYTAATAMLEVAERLTAEEREPAMMLYLLLVGALRSLVEAEHSSTLVLDAFILRALTLSGYEPSFEACVTCGVPGPHRWFNVAGGGVMCSDHRLSGSATVSPAALSVMSALLGRDWATADAATDQIRRETSGVVAAYLQWHLERGMRSLSLVERA